MSESEALATRLAVYRAVGENPAWREVLVEALAVEEERQRFYTEKGYGEFLGWEWHQVHAQMPTLYRMVVARILDVSLKTRSATHFRVRDPEVVRAVLNALTLPEEAVEQTIPSDLFSSIVGHENVKQILQWAIDAKERVGILLQGPPASAKTMFLMELARLPASFYCLAQMMSAAGLAQALRVYEPKYIIIDELDRLNPGDVGVLNSLLSTGWVVELKVGKAPPLQLNTKVFAAGIRIERLPADLLSRFIKFRFPAYTQAQFVGICAAVLPRDGADPEMARSIGEEVWTMRGEKADVRECVTIARLAQGDRERVREILKTLRHLG